MSFNQLYHDKIESGSMNKIKLYSYATSPYAQKVSCYLKYKQLDFEHVPVNPMTNAEIEFTEQRQVPVLEIDGQWRKNSSDLGLWLDQVFPQRPLLPHDDIQSKEILTIDKWVSDELIASVFRYAVEWQNPWYSISNGWRLSNVVSQATPLPLYARILWPFAVKRAKFIVEMVQKMDLTESLPEMNTRLQNEFVTHLAGGPFLASHKNISLADLSAFPAVMNSYFMGMKTKQSLRDHPEILTWAKRVYAQLPVNPFLVPDRLLVRRNL